MTSSPARRWPARCARSAGGQTGPRCACAPRRVQGCRAKAVGLCQGCRAHLLVLHRLLGGEAGLLLVPHPVGDGRELRVVCRVDWARARLHRAAAAGLLGDHRAQRLPLSSHVTLRRSSNLGRKSTGREMLWSSMENRMERGRWWAALPLRVASQVPRATRPLAAVAPSERRPLPFAELLSPLTLIMAAVDSTVPSRQRTSADAAPDATAAGQRSAAWSQGSPGPRRVRRLTWRR